MVFRVEFTDEATANAADIYDWIAERSPDGAERWKAALAEAIRQTADSAGSLALAPETSQFQEDVREIFFKTRRGRRYRMLFVVRGSVAHAVSLRGPGQDFVTPDSIDLPDE